MTAKEKEAPAKEQKKPEKHKRVQTAEGWRRSVQRKFEKMNGKKKFPPKNVSN